MDDVMRVKTRALDATDIANVNAIKEAGNVFVAAIKEAGRNSFPNRELSVAITNAETAVMWAVKGVTG